MADDATLRISTVVDIGPLVAGMEGAAAAVQSSTQQMNQAFASGSASIAASLKATGVSAADAAGALRSQGYSAAEVAATLGQVYGASTAAAGSTDRLATAEESAAAAADVEAGAHLRNTGALVREISARQAATSAVGSLEGRTLSANRAAAAFLSTTVGLGPALQAAFPVIGAVALVDVLVQMEGALLDATDALAGWDKEAKKAYDQAIASNIKLYEETLRNDEAQRQLGELGTRGMERVKAATTAAQGSLKEYGDAAATALREQQRLNETIAALKTDRLKALKGDLSSIGPLGAIGDWISYGRRIDDANEALQRNQTLTEHLADEQRKLGRDIKEKLPAEGRVAASEEEQGLAEARLQTRKRIQDAEVALQEEGAKRLYAMDKISASEEEALLELAANRKLEIERQYQAGLQVLLSKHPDTNAARIEGSKAQVEVAEIQHQARLLQLQTEAEKQQEEQERQFARDVLAIRREVEKQEEEETKKGMEAFAKYQQERLKGMAEASRTIQAEAERHNQATLELEAQRVQNEYQLGQISGQQELAALRAIHAQEHAETLRFLEEQKAAAQRLPDADPSKVAEIAKIDAQIEQENDRHNARMMADDQRTATLRQNLWRSFTTDFNQGMGQIVSASIAGGRNVQQAIGNALEGMIAHEAQFVAQWLLKKAEMWAMDAVLGRASQTTTATTTIVSDAAVAAAGAYAATAAIPFIGPELAPAAALEAEASVLAFLAQASAREGFDVPDLGTGGMVSMLHSREMVLPEEHADTIRALPRLAGGGEQAGGGGDGHFHYHDHSSNQALDGEGLGDVLSKRKDVMAKHVEKLFRSGRLRLR
jgi:hypothetical protein